MRIVNDSSKREKKDFVRAVLDKWLSSEEAAHEQQLVDSMRDADMDKTATDEIDKLRTRLVQREPEPHTGIVTRLLTIHGAIH